MNTSSISCQTPPSTPVAVTAPQRSRLGGYAAKTCPEALSKDHSPNLYPVTLRDDPSAFTADLMNSGNLFETKIGLDIVAAATPGTVVSIVEARDETGERTAEGKAAKEAATFAAWLNPGVAMIFNARIGSVFEALLSAHLGADVSDTDRISEPDAIVFGPVMANGLRSMSFVDVKWHKTFSGKTVRPKSAPVSDFAGPYDPYGDSEEFTGALHLEDWMQLSHYYRHGESLGVVDNGLSPWGAVIGKEEKLVWARLDAKMFRKALTDGGPVAAHTALELYDANFARAMAVVDNAVVRNLDPTVASIVLPEKKTACAECPWRTVCAEELRTYGDGGHITLLPGVTPTAAQPFYRRGITDIRSLARMDVRGADLTDVKHIRQARVFAAGKVARNAGVEFVDLPRADIEIDFDCENATAAGSSENLVYMWGVLATGRKQTGRRSGRERTEMNTFDNYTATPGGERAVFVKTWRYFQRMITKAAKGGHSICFYHYTAYERTQMVALAGKYAGGRGVPTVGEVHEFFGSDMVVDLYEVLHKQLVWPTQSHSIKSLAKWARFSWRDNTPGGDQSMVWYRAAASNNPQVAAANIERLRCYNEDDVAAQLHLRDWLSLLGDARRPGDKLPAVTALRKPLARRRHAA